MQEARKAELSLPGLPGKVPLSPASLASIYMQLGRCRQIFMEEPLGALPWGMSQLWDCPQSVRLGKNRR